MLAKFSCYCFLPTLFSKVFFHSYAFDDVMKLKILKLSSLEYLMNEIFFCSETKNIFLSFKSTLFWT